MTLDSVVLRALKVFQETLAITEAKEPRVSEVGDLEN